jgi:hypothetical protein
VTIGEVLGVEMIPRGIIDDGFVSTHGVSSDCACVCPPEWWLGRSTSSV